MILSAGLTDRPDVKRFHFTMSEASTDQPESKTLALMTRLRLT